MIQTIAITGSRGLIGQFLVAELSKKYSIHTLDISDPKRPVDITDLSSVERAVDEVKPDAIIHLAAFTDVNAAWTQTNDTSGSAYQINVVGTKHIAQVAKASGAHLVHLSTAFVFDGEKHTPYEETDELSPIEWYGQTKAWAETEVQKHARQWSILRIDQPFHHLPSVTKPDLAHQIAVRLQEGLLPPQFTDHYFGPTYIPDLITACSLVLEKTLVGIYHATNNESWTNLKYAQAVAKAIGSKETIKPSLLESYLSTAARPYQKNTALNSFKLWNRVKIKPSSIAQALSKLKLD